jgi:hypothetical protein
MYIDSCILLARAREGNRHKTRRIDMEETKEGSSGKVSGNNISVKLLA